MISGKATEAGTSVYGRRYGTLKYNPLTSSGPQVSQAGFGCYRVSTGFPEQETALETALTSGINLIDTSANYGDGESEVLVGNVLRRLIERGHLSREAIFVVSKVGYLQGRNYALSLERKQARRPFKDLVEYARGLEHCIHPEFIEDQLDRSLERLGLETLDGYLLHNPEYYLGWAKQQKIGLASARVEYYRRIRLAFDYLEKEVKRGRIQCYGISSNTFPVEAEDPEFTCLETALDLAESISPEHHFRLVQFPMNLFETGAALNRNQPSGDTLLEAARGAELGVLINRPLNAFAVNRLVRLAEAPRSAPDSPDRIRRRIDALIASENVLVREILPGMDLPAEIVSQITGQIASGESLGQNWRSFGSLESWRHVLSSYYQPRIQGVLLFLEQKTPLPPEVAGWLSVYRKNLEAVLHVVGSVYQAQAAERAERIKARVRRQDPDWAVGDPTLSQLAVRSLRSTKGVSCVLVGMRHETYVEDVIRELSGPVALEDRETAWNGLADDLVSLL